MMLGRGPFGWQESNSGTLSRSEATASDSMKP